MLLIISFLLFVQPAFHPQHGDLLFQDIDCGPLCDAIEEVTTGIDGAGFSHVGIVVETDSGTYVLEAISKGVVFTLLRIFLDRSTNSLGNPKVIVSRLKPEYSNLIPEAVDEMEKYVGKPYDTLFILGNDAYYCSELIYLGFKAANSNLDFFPLNSMTFKSPGTNTCYPVWKKYFTDMGVEVPEGKPGINPGAISRSGYLNVVHVYGKPDGYSGKFN